MGDRVWMVLQVDDVVHVLPVELGAGVTIVAPGHAVSGLCGCRPEIEVGEAGRAVNHREPTWPDADLPDQLH